MSLTFKIQKKFGSFELDAAGVFAQGITGIFGESGSGKTTLLKCIAGFTMPDQAEIQLDDQIYFSSLKNYMMPLEERNIGMVWQETLLFPHLSVEENVMFGCRPDCPRDFQNNVRKMLEIDLLAKRFPAHLSGGEKQRVAIARALLHQPRLLLMDEPVAALDFPARQRIVSYLKNIHEFLRIPIVYVSHSVSELMFLVNDVYILEKGHCLKSGSPEDVFINEQQLLLLQEDFENIFELPVLAIHRNEKVADLDFGGTILKTAFQRDDQPSILKISLKAKDILIANEHISGISARNKINSVIEKIEPAGDMVMICCRVNQRRVWVEVTPGSCRELKLHLGQMIYLIIKARSIKLLL